MNGIIACNKDAEIYRHYGYDAFSPAMMRQAVENCPEDEALELEVNSYGGDVFAGYEIYSTKAAEALEKVNAVDTALTRFATQEAIMKALTKNGQEQGIYIFDGKIWLNGEYIKADSISANLIKAGILTSQDGKTFVLDLEKNTLVADFASLFISGVDAAQSIREAKAAADDAQDAASDAAYDAYNALRTADSKCRVFTSQPSPPYFVGDLWAQGDGGYILKCVKARSSGAYTSSDWVKADSSVLDLQLSSRNLLKDRGKKISSANYFIGKYVPSIPFIPGEKYAVTLCVTPAPGVTKIGLHTSGGYKWLGDVCPGATGKQILTVNIVGGYASGMMPEDGEANGELCLYRQPNNGTVTDVTKIHWAVAVHGNKAISDWFPAPEDLEAYADAAATKAVNAQTQLDIFNRLTENGKADVFALEAGMIYLNASYIASGILASKDGVTSRFDLTSGQLYTKNAFFEGGKIGGWNIDHNSLYSGNTFKESTVLLCSAATGCNTSFTIGNYTGNGWMFKAGKFGVLYTGAVYGENCDMTGKFVSNDSSGNRMELSAGHLAFYKKGAAQRSAYIGYNSTFDIASITVRGTYGYTASLEAGQYPMFNAPDENSGYEDNVSRVLVWKQVYGNWCLVGIDASQMPADIAL